jgi:hypothetical protein
VHGLTNRMKLARNNLLVTSAAWAAQLILDTLWRPSQLQLEPNEAFPNPRGQRGFR